MNNYRTYGQQPFKAALIHGGPGVPGTMAPVARELCAKTGILEPLQTAISLKDQISELADSLTNQAKTPVTLIGHSWGAMLSYLVTAKYPHLVKKLIMTGSGVFEEEYASDIMITRLDRLEKQDQERFLKLAEQFHQPIVIQKDQIMAELGKLCNRADILDPITLDTEEIKIDYQQFESVWKDLEKIRQSGELLSIGRYIKCPVVVIHGNYDPHPAAGVEKPLSNIIKNFRFILLEKCGHYPWLEKQAKKQFFQLLQQELDY